MRNLIIALSLVLGLASCSLGHSDTDLLLPSQNKKVAQAKPVVTNQPGKSQVVVTKRPWELKQVVVSLTTNGLSKSSVTEQPFTCVHCMTQSILPCACAVGTVGLVALCLLFP